MAVLAIWRYPIKAMLGQRLASARITKGGITGDRRWLVVDRRTNEPIANKRGRTDARLRACRARLTGDDLQVELPDGATARTDEIADALSDLLQTPVELRDGAHHDFAPLHLLTSGALERLRREAPASDWDPRRFRANVVLQGDGELVGRELRNAGGLRLRGIIQTPRCVVPTRATEELPRDPGLLRTLAQRHMTDLGRYGRGACLGAYADVPAEGTLERGELLTLLPAPGHALL